MLPQILYICLLMLGLGVNIAKDGEIQEINFKHSMIAVTIQLGLLWWGGFFAF